MRLAELSNIISVAQQKKLSGGITCNHLKIQDNGSRMLTVSGDVTVTLKVFDLTTKGANQLHRLMNSTRSVIAEKLNGGIGLTGSVFLHKFDPIKKKFTNDSDIYTVAYILTIS